MGVQKIRERKFRLELESDRAFPCIRVLKPYYVPQEHCSPIYESLILLISTF